jgi:hypothetical protein
VPLPLQKPTNPKVEQPNIPPGVVKLPSMLDCGKRAALAEITSRYNEKPFSLSTGFLMTPRGQLVTGQTVMFLNPDTGTYTIIQYFEQESALVDGCIIHSGINFQPFSGVKPEGTKL